MLNESAVMVMEIMYLVLNESVVMVMVVEIMYSVLCARIAKWLECRTHGHRFESLQEQQEN